MRETHQTLKRVTNDFDVRWHFNTSVALMMELVNLNAGGGAAGCEVTAGVLEASV